jgi:hypothetical protein
LPTYIEAPVNDRSTALAVVGLEDTAYHEFVIA